MAEYNAPPLARLIEQFEALPGIGHKTAFKLAYHVLRMSEAEAKKFSDTITEAHSRIKLCRICCNLTDKEVCPICSDAARDKSTICVVEDPRNVIAFEHTGEYHGLYHVLHGSLSPVAGITADALRIKELIARFKTDEIKEVIMATNPTIEGDATSMYISKLLKPLGVKITRLAFGVPVGGDIEYSDDISLVKSLENRQEI